MKYMREKFILSMNPNRIVCAFLLAIACAPALRAQTDSSVDGVTVKGDKVYGIQGGSLEVLMDNLKLPFDVEVTTNGSFMVARGKERKLEEGQVLRSDGWLLNPDGSMQPVFDHVTMRNGHVMVVRDGEATRLTEPMRFPNNLSIAPDGSCNYPDGSPSRLADGQAFRLDGTAIPAKDAVTLKSGRVVVQKDGTLIPLSPGHIMGMNDGTRVYGNGQIQKHDGTTTQLRDGQTILIAGPVIKR
jgi:hypothetical protein